MTPATKKAITIISIIAVIILIVVISAFTFKKIKPGVYAPYKCNQNGDDSSKFYGDNFKARGAVCDGLYIPINAKINGKDTTKVLEWMGELYNTDTQYANAKTDKALMKKLAEDAASNVQ